MLETKVERVEGNILELQLDNYKSSNILTVCCRTAPLCRPVSAPWSTHGTAGSLLFGLENMVWGISIVSRSAGSRFSRLIPFFEIANSCASSRFLFRSNPDLTFPPFSRFETMKLSYVRSKFHSLRPQNGRNSWESETLNPKASTWQSGYSAD